MQLEDMYFRRTPNGVEIVGQWPRFTQIAMGVIINADKSDGITFVGESKYGTLILFDVLNGKACYKVRDYTAYNDYYIIQRFYLREEMCNTCPSKLQCLTCKV